MKLIDTISNGLIGVYSLEDALEREAVNHIFNANVNMVKPKGDAQTQFAQAAGVLFPGISLQVAWDYADVHQRENGEAFISKTPSQGVFGGLKGTDKKYVGACVNLPKELDRTESCSADWFSGRYNAGTLMFMKMGSDANVVYATLNISRFYDVCGQHEMDIVGHSYKRDVVDDIVDKLGEQQQDLAIRSPMVDSKLGGVFVPGFSQWEEILSAYDKARSLLESDSWSRREWNAIRRDSLGADNPVVREQSAERYKARLSEFVRV